jgi:hypothetical protein
MEDKYVNSNARTLEIFEEILNGFWQVGTIKELQELDLGTRLKELEYPEFKKLFIKWREKASPQLVNKSLHTDPSLKYTWKEGLTREEIIEQGIAIMRKVKL